MAIRVDWKYSLIMTVILIGCLYALQYFIEDRNTYCIAAIILFVAFMAIGNLILRRR